MIAPVFEGLLSEIRHAARTLRRSPRFALVVILALVLRGGLALTVAGLGLGTAAAAGAARVLESLLFGVTPVDATTYASVLLLVFLMGLLAAYVPARRALRVDPRVALSTD